MRVRVSFYSYFKTLAGCEQTGAELPAGSTLAVLEQQIAQRFPQLAGLQRSTLIAVGVDYQDRAYILQEGDDVSFFPPVQGG